MDPYATMLKRLADHEVRFVVIGGYAIALHGALVLTADVDVCAPLDTTNLARLITALAGTNPVHRFHVKRIPLHDDAAQLAGVRNLYLRTDIALLDVLGEVPGVGSFDAVFSRSVEVPFHGSKIHILGIEALIDAKRTAGRDKDKSGLNHLEALKRERDRGSGSTPGLPANDPPTA